MPADEALLEANRSHRDERTGVEERFFRECLGHGEVVGVLSRPLREVQPTGFVLCHSFGLEQLHLARLETLAARRLAAAGFPVLRFHGHGYGDSDGSLAEAGLGSHLAEATDAVRFLARETGVVQVATAGARFGGTVAGLVAAREGLPGMILWEPVVSGRRLIRDLIRSRLLTEMVEREADAHAEALVARGDVRAELVARGWSDIGGLRLSNAVAEEISQVDLGNELTGFSGVALVLSVSRSAAPSPGVGGLAGRIEAAGGRCETTVLQDRSAAQFGSDHHVNLGGDTKIDIQAGLVDRIVERTAEWASRMLGQARRREAPSVTGGVPE